MSKCCTGKLSYKICFADRGLHPYQSVWGITVRVSSPTSTDGPRPDLRAGCTSRQLSKRRETPGIAASPSGFILLKRICSFPKFLDFQLHCIISLQIISKGDILLLVLLFIKTFPAHCSVTHYDNALQII